MKNNVCDDRGWIDGLGCDEVSVAALSKLNLNSEYRGMFAQCWRFAYDTDKYLVEDKILQTDDFIKTNLFNWHGIMVSWDIVREKSEVIIEQIRGVLDRRNVVGIVFDSYFCPWEVNYLSEGSGDLHLFIVKKVENNGFLCDDYYLKKRNVSLPFELFDKGIFALLNAKKDVCTQTSYKDLMRNCEPQSSSSLALQCFADDVEKNNIDISKYDNIDKWCRGEIHRNWSVFFWRIKKYRHYISFLSEKYPVFKVKLSEEFDQMHCEIERTMWLLAKGVAGKKLYNMQRSLARKITNIAMINEEALFEYKRCVELVSSSE